MPDSDPCQSDDAHHAASDDAHHAASDDAHHAASDDAHHAASDDVDGYVGRYDKLVRDDIPAVVREDGNEPVTRTVDGAEYRRYLAAKLVEEAEEYADALHAEDATAARAESDEVLDELADVHAVLDAIVDATTSSQAAIVDATTSSQAAIVDATTSSQAAIDARKREKTDERGGFADGVVLERIEPDGSNELDE